METKNKIYLGDEEVTEELDRQLLQNSFEQLMGLAIKIVGKKVMFPHIKMKLRSGDGATLYAVFLLISKAEEDEA